MELRPPASQPRHPGELCVSLPPCYFSVARLTTHSTLTLHPGRRRTVAWALIQMLARVVRIIDSHDGAALDEVGLCGLPMG
jgi:hypothetical protein